MDYNEPHCRSGSVQTSAMRVNESKLCLVDRLVNMGIVIRSLGNTFDMPTGYRYQGKCDVKACTRRRHSGREWREYSGYNPIGVYVVEIIGTRNIDGETIRANRYVLLQIILRGLQNTAHCR